MKEAIFYLHSVCQSPLPRTLS